MEKSLRNALGNNEFALYYQPQYDLATGRIYSFEALLRWVSPQYGNVLPAKFIRFAEESGLIIPIGKWVLKTACSFLKSLHDRGYNEIVISVNISVAQLMQNDFVEMITNILNEVSLDPTFLELELTESIIMETLDTNYKKLERLLQLGITISIDDFGKGYSSLSYLKSLPVNKLKIDKSFIEGIGSNKDFTGSIVEIGHRIGLDVVAEGVETKEQLDYLSQAKCNFAQGYWLGMPVSADEALKQLEGI
ncbi:MAG: putative bifunctional diguanylate cyclase/phosphodiesterase [Bacillota bacterium]|nr:EAL domain-containing protein [Clostridia bacterium]